MAKRSDDRNTMAVGTKEPEVDAEHVSTLRHPLVSGSTIAVIFLLLRLMAVSHWDWKTAFHIVDIINFNDAITIVFGTLFAEPLYTAVIIMVLLPLTVLGTVWSLTSDESVMDTAGTGLFAVALTTCTIGLGLTYQYWWLIVGSAALGAGIVVVRLLWRRGLGYRFIGWILRRTALIGSIGALMLATVVADPWAPLEHIETTSGGVDGYTLKVDSGYLNVLTEEDREIVIIMGNDVLSRTAH